MLTIPVITDGPPSGTNMTAQQEQNWNGLISPSIWSSAAYANMMAVGALKTTITDYQMQASQGSIVPVMAPLVVKTVSWLAFSKLWAELVPMPNSFDSFINVTDAINVNTFYLPLTATAVADSSGNIEITYAPPPAQTASTNPLGAPVSNYPGLRYAIPGDANPDYFIFTAPDGTKWQRETVIMLGPIYQELP